MTKGELGTDYVVAPLPGSRSQQNGGASRLTAKDQADTELS